jgi:hypothetical protein
LETYVFPEPTWRWETPPQASAVHGLIWCQVTKVGWHYIAPGKPQQSKIRHLSRCNKNGGWTERLRRVCR